MKIEIKMRMEIKIVLISTAGKRPKVAENEEQGDKNEDGDEDEDKEER